MAFIQNDLDHCLVRRKRAGATADMSLVAPTLPLDEFELACVEAFKTRRLALRHTLGARLKDARLVERFREFAGKPLYQLTPGDFDAWAAHLYSERGISHGTQRNYQSAIIKLWEFLEGSHELQTQLWSLHQSRFASVVTAENSITHVHTRETVIERDQWTVDDIERLFDAIRTRIGKLDPGSLSHVILCRDLAFFGTMYYLSTRVSETTQVNLDDHESGPWAPDLGTWAQVHIRQGKGSKGSGPKARMVPVTSADFVNIIEWYLQSVRPRLLRPYVDAGRALFLNRDGRRVERSSQMQALKRVLRLAGFDPARYCTHSMRHASITHEVQRTDFEFGRFKGGHVFASTTQEYTHVPLAYQQQIVRELVEHSMA